MANAPEGRIRFCDLTRALDTIAGEISDAMARVRSSGWFLRGREVESFEAEWAEYCGQEYCVSCNSGTDALTIAALALGMDQAFGGDRVYPCREPQRHGRPSKLMPREAVWTKLQMKT